MSHPRFSSNSLKNNDIRPYRQTLTAVDAASLVAALNHPQLPRNSRVGRLLLEHGVINEQQLNKVLEIQKNSEERICQIIQKHCSVMAEDICMALAEQLGAPYVKLRDFDFEQSAVHFVPEEVAREHLVMPLFVHPDSGSLVVAMEDPTDKDTIDLLHFITGRVLEITVSTRADIDMAVAKFYGPIDDSDLLADIDSQVFEPSHKLTEAEIFKLGTQKPTVRLVHNILLDAISSHASDVHIRPKEDSVDLLFRVDGSLLKIRSFNKNILSPIVSRIKILGGMNIAEHRLPQDGQAVIKRHGQDVDMRISIIPSIYGESTVIRILDTHTSLRRLKDIGFNLHDMEAFSSIISKSAGLILVTGPTGSGKSTTLYAALNEITPTKVNVITVEDPVEYHIDNVLQIQVRPQTGLTFARALRHILRHDPDVVMVGEIRDQETAKIAVESSLTGHLVLSTLHTNSAASSVTRLLEIGIEPYLLNSTLQGVLAQRLVRQNCPHCTAVEEVSDAVRAEVGAEPGEVFYKGAGCAHCYQTGYSGRIAVYELLVVTPEIRECIIQNADAAHIEKVACELGMTTLTSCALEVARQRRTSLAEVYRVRLT